MTGPTAASPTDKHPRYHLTLSDGTDSVGFVVGRMRGDDFVPDHRSIQRTGLERNAIKTREGVSDYADFDIPYMTILQDDWSGGRGLDDFDKDNSRYFDNYRCIPSEKGIILGPHEVYTRGYRSSECHLDETSLVTQAESFVALSLLTDYRYIATSFVASATYTNTGHPELWVRYHGSPAALTVAIYSNSAGDPGSSLGTVTLSALTSNLPADTWVLYDFPAFSSLTISSGTTYHIVVYAGADDASNYWKIGCDTSGSYTTTNASSNGTVWAGSIYYPLFRLLDTDADFTGHFFEYKRGWYFVKNPDTGANSTLYLLGDRGVADSNSSDKTYLEDGSKTWTADEWIDSILLLTRGPGSEEEQPWRVITDNDTNSLQVSPTWNVAHTTSTEYVILNAKKWKSVIGDMGGVVSDVVVAGDFIYFCRGTATLLRYQWYNNGGAEADRNAAETYTVAEKGVYINHPGDGPVVYFTRNDHAVYTSYVFKGFVPPFWDALMRSKVELLATEEPWDDPDG